MDSFNGADVCYLVSVYFQNRLTYLKPKHQVALYRYNGLTACVQRGPVWRYLGPSFAFPVVVACAGWAVSAGRPKLLHVVSPPLSSGAV